ncbi:MAG: hypothetical protein EAZ85_01030 [Bacteroidetes bacterium]|nr:MAG: hypothetical protein EAZ85_01030 [Bacteroidota bacterium]TAG88214.1 MAG: hypothetical protein EAZ20_09025 [Bacteroidota bacterium]
MKFFLISFCFSALLFINQNLLAQEPSFEIQSKGTNNKLFVPIKGDKIDGQNKFAYMFNSLSVYKIKIKHSKKQVLIKILDENENELANNFDEKNKKYATKLNFKCTKTARYYVQFEEKN